MVAVQARAQVPVPYANIVWQDTSVGAVADSNGLFSIEQPVGYQYLVVSALGYRADTLAIMDNHFLTITLALESKVLKEVVVAKERDATSISGVSTINTTKLSENEFKKAACCNLSEAFETNASVDVMYSDAITGAKEIRMLGLDGAYSQMMVENIPSVRGLGSTFGLTYIPGPWLESIQISKGTGTVVNGYESMTGQINVELKKPNESPRLHLNTYVNHLGRTEGSLNLAKQFNPKIGSMLFLHGNFFGTRIDANDDTFLDLPLINQFNVFNRWRFDPNKFWEIQMGVKALYEDRTGGQWEFDERKEVATQPWFGLDMTTQRYEGFVKAGRVFPGAMERSVGIITNLSYHHQQGWYGRNSYTGRETNLYTNLLFQSHVRNPRHTLKSGISFMLDGFDEHFSIIQRERMELVPGGFVEYGYNPNQQLSLLAGMRLDCHNLFGLFATPRLHLKYNPAELTTIRLNAGRGYRVANIFAENTNVLTSSRQIIILETLKPEIAWNFGLNFTQKFSIAKRSGTFNVDIYRTQFENQVILDLDQDVHQALFYNLDGKSYSNSLQVELQTGVAKGLDIRLAYKFNDVKTTYSGQLLAQVHLPRHTGLINMAYATPKGGWKFDATAQLNGRARLPQGHRHAEVQVEGGYSPIYVTINAQVTKVWKKWEWYVGGENINGFTQRQPILGWEQPFSNQFDAASVWGPIYGRIFYLGMRYTFN
ncbi:MAG: TonB-dependent receptor [Chitinophagales bacterium]|nr:TonB-dependent receptor [Chitinophagales bacterium]